MGYCWLIEANGTPIGECWLVSWNEKCVSECFSNDINLRRIDMMIGEKSYWGKGIGTVMIGMLVDFAFNGEYADTVTALTFEDNIRSRRVFEKNGFVRFEVPNSDIGDVHFQLTRRQYVQQHRTIVPPEKTFLLPLSELQPSQLYISEGKLRLAREWRSGSDMDAIPIKELDGRKVMTDGHTRAVMAYLEGAQFVSCCRDEDALDWDAYRRCVKWCDDEGITGVAALAKRIVPHADYERLWLKRCRGSC
jgi:GNAT superfamily N-acetyltransferase